MDEEVDKLGTEEEQERFNEIVVQLGRKPKVLNKRTDKIPPDAVYVGRPSKWGNPFPITKSCLRSMSISLYSGYMKNNPELYNQLNELRGKDLVCWCAPLPCHADILLELANKGG